MTPATPSAIRAYSPPPKKRISNHSAALKPRKIDDEASGGTTVQDADARDVFTPDFASFEKSLTAGLDPEAAYRKLKANHVYQDRFYLEAARVLCGKQKATLARRVLSNMVESRPGDLSAIRAYAFWLAEFGQTDEASGVLIPLCEEGAASLPPRLDLASILATGKNAAGAAETLFPALNDIHSGQSGSLAALALTEYNALYRSSGQSAGAHPMRRFERYTRNLAADIRIVATSTGDANSLQFQVQEPDGFECSNAASPSPTGGNVSTAGGRREYMIRRAVPGTYQITCASDHPVTVRLVLHTRWGYPDQQSKVVTLLLDDGRMQQVGEIEFDFRASKIK